MDATVSAVVRQRLAMVFVRGDVDGNSFSRVGVATRITLIQRNRRNVKIAGGGTGNGGREWVRERVRERGWQTRYGGRETELPCSRWTADCGRRTTYDAGVTAEVYGVGVYGVVAGVVECRPRHRSPVHGSSHRIAGEVAVVGRGLGLHGAVGIVSGAAVSHRGRPMSRSG